MRTQPEETPCVTSAIFSLQMHSVEPGIAVPSCHSTLGEAKSGRVPEMPGQPGLQKEFQGSWNYTVKPGLK